MMLRIFPPFVGPNVISESPNNGLSTRQFLYQQNAWNDAWCSDKCRKACYAKQFACANSQRNTKESVFWFAQRMLCILMLHNFPPYFRPNVIFKCPDKWVVDSSIGRGMCRKHVYKDVETTETSPPLPPDRLLLATKQHNHSLPQQLLQSSSSVNKFIHKL